MDTVRIEGIDLAWVAQDSEGQVAVFTSNGILPVPAVFAADSIDARLDKAFGLVDSLPMQAGSFEIGRYADAHDRIIPNTKNLTQLHPTRGLFYFDGREYIEAAESCYAKIYEPLWKLNVRDLNEELAWLFSICRFNINFNEIDLLDLVSASVEIAYKLE